MKKSLLILALLTACKQKVTQGYPVLESEPPAVKAGSADVSDSCYTAYQWFQKLITTAKAEETAIPDTGKVPWEACLDYNVKQVQQLLNQLCTGLRHTAPDRDNSGTLDFVTTYPRKSEALITPLHVTVTGYTLQNEKNKPVTVDTSFISVTTTAEKNELWVSLSAEERYRRLQGHMQFTIEVPVRYEYRKLTSLDLGKPFTLAGRKLELVELQDAVIHLKEYAGTTTGTADYQIYVINNRGEHIAPMYSGNTVSEEEYAWYRHHPKVALKEFCEWKEQFPGATRGDKVTVYRLHDANIKELYLYAPVELITKTADVVIRQ